jgi:hypothetical protein
MFATNRKTIIKAFVNDFKSVGPLQLLLIRRCQAKFFGLLSLIEIKISHIDQLSGSQQNKF